MLLYFLRPAIGKRDFTIGIVMFYIGYYDFLQEVRQYPS